MLKPIRVYMQNLKDFGDDYCLTIEGMIASTFLLNSDGQADFPDRVLWFLDGQTSTLEHRLEEEALWARLRAASDAELRAEFTAIRRRCVDQIHRCHLAHHRESPVAYFDRELAEAVGRMPQPLEKGSYIRAAMWVECGIRDEAAYRDAEGQAAARFEEMAYGLSA